jgi:hypothetical protein
VALACLGFGSRLKFKAQGGCSTERARGQCGPGPANRPNALSLVQIWCHFAGARQAAEAAEQGPHSAKAPIFLDRSGLGADWLPAMEGKIESV